MSCDDLAVDILQSSAPTFREFCREIVLPDGDSKGLSYEPELHPAQACIVDAIDRGSTSITIAKPVQDGGSLVAFAAMLWRVCAKGHTAILAYPTLTAARDAWSKKISPILAAMGKLPERGSGSAGGVGSVVNTPGGGSIIFRSAGGRHEAGQASATGDILIPDEVDDWPDMRRVKLIEQRITKSPDPLIVYISTVKRDGEGKDESHILRLVEAGTKTRLHYPCPHCGGLQPWEWERVDCEAGTIQCKHCERHLTDGERIASLKHWHRIDTNKTPAFSIVWTALDSPFPIVVNGRKQPMISALIGEHQYAEQQAALGDHSFMRQFYRDRLTRPYRGDIDQDDAGSTTIPTRNRLAALSTRSPYAIAQERADDDGDRVHLCDVPAGLEHATLAIDVQRGGDKAPGRLYFAVLGRGNGKGAILGWGSVVAAPVGRQPTRAEFHQALERLDGLMRDWELPVPLVARGIDVGWGQDEIVPWIRAHRDYWAIKGTGPLKATEYGDRAGWLYKRRQEAGWMLRLLETKSALRVVHGEILSEALLLPRGLDRQSTFIRHLCATVEFAPDKWSSGPKDRVHHLEWQSRDDYGQCLAYCRALAYDWESRPVKLMEEEAPEPLPRTLLPTSTPRQESWVSEGTDTGGGWI